MEGECENEKKETRVHGALGVLKNSREAQYRSQIHTVHRRLSEIAFFTSKPNTNTTGLKMATLPKATHILSGAESQRLRSFCSSAVWNSSHLDAYSLLQNGPLSLVKADFQRVDASSLGKSTYIPR